MCIRQHIIAGRMIKGMSFYQLVWALCARVPCGKVTTYAAIARALGKDGAARAVGAALHRNPYAPKVPCHRVVGADGRLGGFAGGVSKKRRMLKQEGVKIIRDHVVLDKSTLFDDF